ncbi:MAG: transcription antitermination factor NusB [Eubacteriales bacterium]|nr:MAG: transcription antitermination factor NusB [Firmicutes bacterium HGW-Firmicutes-8]
MSRRAAREAALQTLFQIDIGKISIDKAVAFVVEENKLKKKQEEFIRLSVQGVMENLDRIDNIINEVSIDWDLGRMADVDRSIIRLALYEICFSEEVPPNVAVNEAIELGKTFSTAESGKFINGILGKVLVNLPKYRQKQLTVDS